MVEGKFQYAKLKRDLADNGVSLYKLAALFKQHCPGEVDSPTVYAWFARGRIPLERLMQLIAVARLETQREFRIDDYVQYYRYRGKKKSAAKVAA